MSRTLILLGALLIVAGVLLHFSGRLPWLGKLPGDIVIKRENFSFYALLGTSLFLSVVISLIVMLFHRR